MLNALPFVIRPRRGSTQQKKLYRWSKQSCGIIITQTNKRFKTPASLLLKNISSFPHLAKQHCKFPNCKCQPILPHQDKRCINTSGKHVRVTEDSGLDIIPCEVVRCSFEKTWASLLRLPHSQSNDGLETCSCPSRDQIMVQSQGNGS